MSISRQNVETARKTGQEFRSGAVPISEHIEKTISGIQKEEPRNHCFVTLFEEQAHKAAIRVAQKLRSKEDCSLLAGVPVGVDDTMMTRGRRTTCGSGTLEHFIPTFSATAVQKLEDAGMIIVGKLNTDEFSMGSLTQTSFFGPTSHPADETRVAGAAAAAVASGVISCALASDTGGALRQASAGCGVCGIRPTYGAVSRLGLAAFASSMDQIGPIASDIRDCAEILNIISGKDPCDSTSVEIDKIDLSRIDSFSLSGLRIGIPSVFFESDTDPFVKASFHEALDALRSEGAVTQTFSLKGLDQAVAAYAVISCAEASANLSRIDGIKYGFRAPEAKTLSEVYERTRSVGFGSDAQKRIMLGNYFLSAERYEEYYLRALRVKALIAKGFASAFRRYDVILSPVSPSLAPKKEPYDTLSMFEEDFFTVPASLAGLPAASVPCGKNPDGLSVGLQMIGPHFSEAKIVGAADAFLRIGGGQKTQGGQK